VDLVKTPENVRKLMKMFSKLLKCSKNPENGLKTPENVLKTPENVLKTSLKNSTSCLAYVVGIVSTS
jgi:hypothetical protein